MCWSQALQKQVSTSTSPLLSYDSSQAKQSTLKQLQKPSSIYFTPYNTYNQNSIGHKGPLLSETWCNQYQTFEG